MSRAIDIGGRTIGDGRPCFVIAEAGVNHNGDVALAEQLIEAAHDAGADCVKFQTWITEKVVAPTAPLVGYQARTGATATSQFELLKPLELSYEDFRALKAYADSRGIVFLATPDEEGSADFLESLGVVAFKISSAEVTNLPFVRHVACKGRPVILSTGMSSLEEVERAVAAVEEEGNRELVLLQCVSSYPADPEDVNLRAMDTLASLGYPVGFSDHTLGIDVALAAVARGACVLEKHLTLDRSLDGPDHAASIEPAELAQLVRSVRRVEAALGDGVKRITDGERESRKALQKVVVTRRMLRAGEVITDADVTLLRADAGLPPESLDWVVGRRAARDVAAHSALTADLVV